MAIATAAVGSERVEFIARRILQDLYDQQQDQPDHWVLVRSVLQRLQLSQSDLDDGLSVGIANEWLETDSTFKRATRRARLTARGRLMLLSVVPRMNSPTPWPANEVLPVRSRLTSRLAPMRARVTACRK